MYMRAFRDEMEKIALAGTTVWGRATSAFEQRVADELKKPGQVRSIAEKLVYQKHPIYKKWPLRTITHWAKRR